MSKPGVGPGPLPRGGRSPGQGTQMTGPLLRLGAGPGRGDLALVGRYASASPGVNHGNIPFPALKRVSDACPRIPRRPIAITGAGLASFGRAVDRSCIPAPALPCAACTGAHH
jgi:hypothetical protein